MKIHKLINKEKKCLNHCPNCGAGTNDIDWLDLVSDINPYQNATCKKCGCNFKEVYQYCVTAFDLNEVPRVPCSSPLNQFYNYMDEVPEGTRVSTPEDCNNCKEKCEDSHCLIGNNDNNPDRR